MSDVRKFKFVSPGIFLREIDNSQLPAVAPEVGPVFVGRARKGPANRPYAVESFSEFVDVFGAPIAGGGGGDYFREGNIAGPTYGVYAAQAYLDAQVGPVTYVRMLGEQNPANAGTSDATAGWNTNQEFSGDQDLDIRRQKGGAYGLFVHESSSALTTLTRGTMTGSLAAIFYCNSGSSIILSGGAPAATATDEEVQMSGAAMVLSSNSTMTFTAMVMNDVGDELMKTEFNFNRNSDKYIRKVFNANPTTVNSTITNTSLLSDGEPRYWLGETYDSYLFEKLGSDSGKVFGFIAAINSGSTDVTTAGSNQWADRKTNFINPRTGWFFSQDLTSVGGAGNAAYDAKNMTKLFRFYGRDGGEYIQENYKISIQDIRSSTNDFDAYGSFTVVIRSANDSDSKPNIIERFSECNLNPQSQNYVARKIGDRFVEWDYDDRRMREYGEFANRSEIVRIEMNPDINSIDARLLPFGVFGPPRPPGFMVLSGSSLGATGTAGAMTRNVTPLIGDSWQTLAITGTLAQATPSYSYVEGTGSVAIPFNRATLSADMAKTVPMEVQTHVLGATWNAGNQHTASLFFPTTLTRLSASDHGTTVRDAYWGLQTNYWTSGRTSTAFDLGYRDYLRGLPLDEANRFGTLSGEPSNNEYSWIFTLDDLVVADGSYYWMSGSRSGVSRENTTTVGDSITSASYQAALDAGLGQFTSPMFGGFDGFNITEKDPFRDGFMSTSATAINNYAYNTVDKALNAVKDPEAVEMNMLSVPGIVNENLTQKVIDVCEDRGDALGVIDLRGIYQPFTENFSSFKDRVRATTLDGVVTALRDRSINSSYGCAYYPWVQVRDTLTGQFLWVPPSVPAIGTMASSERASEVWFAPAGFNRGGLSKNGAAGIPVTAVTERLTSADRDKLYEANINPIATFPSEGIVIFGQKTLQVTPSALDRVNVRRLMIFIKKEISRIAAGILFDQNVPATWLRFTGQAEPLLASVKARMGLTEFRVVLDETTTTPDLVDRNILYAKIFLKPARAIEFIAIDFNITRTGAAFTD